METEIEKIYETMTTVHSIRCTNCRIISNQYDCNEETSSEMFYKNGWRVSDFYVYCPKCSEANGKL